MLLTRETIDARRTKLLNKNTPIDPSTLTAEKQSFLQKMQESVLHKDNAIHLHHPAVQSLLAEASVLLRPITKLLDKNITLPSLLCQASGLFLVEFYWRLRDDGTTGDGRTSNWHVVVVNCDWRLIFCNTLGVIPFTDTMNKESSFSHTKVSRRFHVNHIFKVWTVFKVATVSAQGR